MSRFDLTPKQRELVAHALDEQSHAKQFSVKTWRDILAHTESPMIRDLLKKNEREAVELIELAATFRTSDVTLSAAAAQVEPSRNGSSTAVQAELAPPTFEEVLECPRHADDCLCWRCSTPF